MKKILFVVLLLAGLMQAAHVPQRREANAAPEPLAAAAPQPAAEPLVLPDGDHSDAADDDDDDDDDDKSVNADEQQETTTLGIVSIKSRAIAMDRGLCKELSRYHPHYPKCHEYCKKLEHWIGMCRRESCHCIS